MTENKGKILLNDLDDLDDIEVLEDLDEMEEVVTIKRKDNTTKGTSRRDMDNDEDSVMKINLEVPSERFIVKGNGCAFPAHEVNSQVCNDSIMDVVVCEVAGTGDVERMYELYIYDYTTQPVIVSYMADDSIEVQLPKLASEEDTALCYAYLTALKSFQSDCAITLINGKAMDISEEAAQKKVEEHNAYLEKLLARGDESLEIQGKNGTFHPLTNDVIKSASASERLSVVWTEFQKSQWEEK